MFHQIGSKWGDNLTYLVGDDISKRAFVVDTAGNVDKVLELSRSEGMVISHIIHTHDHSDHTSDSEELAKVTKAMIVVHESSRWGRGLYVKDGGTLKVGAMELRFIHTPGHTPESMCIVQSKNLFTGDTLFVGECGRTDMPGGDSRALYDSFEKLRELPDDLIIWPGHDYGGLRSTMGKEKRENYTLKRRTMEEFIRFMAEP